MTTEESALQLASLGYCVAACYLRIDPATGKKIVGDSVSWGSQSTTDPETIRNWFATGRFNAYVIDCEKSGVAVADLDTYHRPDAVDTWLQAGGSSSPFTVRTQNGGQHRFFRADPEVALKSTKNEQLGVDHRATGGAIFGPGSLVEGGGTYVVLGEMLAPCDLPPVDVDAVLATGGKLHREDKTEKASPVDPDSLTDDEVKEVRGWIEESLSVISALPDGDRHEPLLSETGRIFRNGQVCGADWDELEERVRNAYHLSGGRDETDLDNVLRDSRKWARDNPKRYNARNYVTPTVVRDMELDLLVLELKAHPAPRLKGFPGNEHTEVARVVAKYLYGRYIFVQGIGWHEWLGDRWSPNPRVPVSDYIGDLITQERGRALAVVKAVEGSDALESLRFRLQREKNARGGKGGGAVQPQELTLQTKLDEIEKLLGPWQLAVKWWSALSHGRDFAYVLRFVSEHAPIYHLADEIDRRDHWLNCTNGTVDLRDGTLNAHSPDDLITKTTGVAYVPDAYDEMWAKAKEGFAPGIENWLKRRIGSGAFGRPDYEETMLFSFGKGSNSKSTLSDAILYALGDYAISLHDKAVLGSPNDHGAEQMVFKGARWCILEELPEAQVLRPQHVKKLIGTSRITARMMRQDPVTFDATHSVLVNSNHRPQVLENDHGTWRRLISIPWPYTFREKADVVGENDRVRDIQVKASLSRNDSTKQAVLAWIVQGAVEYTAAGDSCGDLPAVVAESTRTWREEADFLGQFLADRTMPDPGYAVAGVELLEEFNRFMQELGKNRVSSAYVSARIGDVPGFGSVTPGQFVLNESRQLSRLATAGAKPSKVRGYAGLRWR